jgi:type II secretory pathway component GspD/PulD (secretin)
MSALLSPWACRALLAATLVGAAPGCVRGDGLRLPAGPYKYIVIDQDLREVLAEFGRNTNVVVKLSDDVQGRVRGPLPVSSPEEFLTRLMESYGLVNYYDGAVLQINAATELRTELLDIGNVRADEVSSKLKEMGLVDPRFRLSVTADARVISVSGPPPYVARVKEMLAVLARATAQRPGEIGDDSRVRVFRGGT